MKALFFSLSLGWSLGALLSAVFGAPAQASESSSGPPAVMRAIEKGDAKAYAREMSQALHGPAPEFFKIISSASESGDTIFHKLAAAGDSPDAKTFFAGEMESLHSWLFPDERSGPPQRPLGGVHISVPALEETNIGKAVQAQDPFAVIKQARLLFSKGTAAEALQILHARTESGGDLKGFLIKNLSFSQLMEVRDSGLENTIRETFPQRDLLSKLNKEDLTAKDIAYKEGSEAAYLFLKSKGPASDGWGSVLGVSGVLTALVAGSAVTGADPLLSLGLHYWPEGGGFLIAAEWLAYIAAGGAAGEACHRAFIKRKLNRRFGASAPPRQQGAK